MEEQVTALSPLHSNKVAAVTAETRVAAKRKPGGSASQSIKWYKQKFRDSWLEDDRFKNWLVSVPNDPYRARCKLCNADLRAGKSELEKHARTKHHRDTVRAVDDVKALLGFANQAEAQTLPEMTDMQSADQIQEEELSRPVTTFGPRKRRASPPPVAAPPAVRYHLPPWGILPQVHYQAPDFKGIAVVDNQVREVQLSDYEGKYLLLFFYPQDFSLACPSELVEYSERAAEFRSLNTEIVAISTDSYFTHLSWTNTPRKLGGLGKANVALMSDFTKKISKDYNVLIEATGMALRASFIIDTKAMIRQITINDLNLYRSVDETLRLLKALQYIEKHGTGTDVYLGERCRSPDDYVGSFLVARHPLHVEVHARTKNKKRSLWNFSSICRTIALRILLDVVGTVVEADITVMGFPLNYHGKPGKVGKFRKSKLVDTLDMKPQPTYYASNHVLIKQSVQRSTRNLLADVGLSALMGATKWTSDACNLNAQPGTLICLVAIIIVVANVIRHLIFSFLICIIFHEHTVNILQHFRLSPWCHFYHKRMFFCMGKHTDCFASYTSIVKRLKSLWMEGLGVLHLFYSCFLYVFFFVTLQVIFRNKGLVHAYYLSFFTFLLAKIVMFLFASDCASCKCWCCKEMNCFFFFFSS